MKGLSIKDLDGSVLPACAPLLAIIEGSLYDDLLCDDLCWSVKEIFESNAEIGDTMLDRGLSIVLTNVVARQTDLGNTITEGTLALLHAVVAKCCTTNVEHFTVVKDILDALSNHEMKLHDLDDSEVLDTEDSHPNVCSECSKIAELRKILFSVYWVAIESLLNATDLAISDSSLFPENVSDFSGHRVRQSRSLILNQATTSTPRKDKISKSQSSTSTFMSNAEKSNGPKEQKTFKIPESELTQRLSLIIKGAIKRVEYQGTARCHIHANDLVDELGAKHTQLG